MDSNLRTVPDYDRTSLRRQQKPNIRFNKNIIDIQYNILNLPDHITFANGIEFLRILLCSFFA